MKRYNVITLLTGLTLALALLVTSCNSTKTIPHPQADTQALYRDADTAKVDTTTIADMAWNTFFTDTLLQGLINEGLANNLDLQVAQKRIEQSEAALMLARGALYPTLSAGVQTNQTRLSNGADGTKVLGYSSASSANSVGFVASWEIDVWGKLRNQKKAKIIAYQNSLEYKTFVQTNLMANIATGYYTLLALDEQLSVTLGTIEVLKRNVETMQAMKDAGTQTGAAVEGSKAQLYNAQLSVPVLESQIRKQENTLSTLLGRKPGAIVRGKLANETVPETLAIGIPVQLLSRRPDVIQAELSFRQAFALTKAAKASLYPSFNISSASLGFAGEFANMFDVKYIAGSLIGSVMQPIFYKNQIRGNIKASQAQQDEALLNFQNALLKAGQEVSGILDSYESSLQKNSYRALQVQSLTNAVDYTHELLIAGEANYIEVLNAQSSLLSAQINQINDKLEQLNYTVSLYKALGGGRN